MITPEFVATMTRYNAWRNGDLLRAADALDEAALDEDRGAFFGSIRGTMSHLLWADQLWLSRLAKAEPPSCGLPGSAALHADWTALKVERREMDAAIDVWAASVTPDWLAGRLRWFSGASGREMEKPVSLCVAHFFNHQTHHRGQIHAMLTAAGAPVGDTDLVFMPEA
jgi:uncharacterized damage-inducible protein DinB